MACIGAEEQPDRRIEDSVQARDEHVGGMSIAGPSIRSTTAATSRAWNALRPSSMRSRPPLQICERLEQLALPEETTGKLPETGASFTRAEKTKKEEVQNL